MGLLERNGRSRRLRASRFTPAGPAAPGAFPPTPPSAVNPFAPLVSRNTMKAFAARAELGGALRRSLDRMLSFYGLRRSATAGGVRIEIDETRFAERSVIWLRPGNHNHLRLTRIMQSLPGPRPPAQG